MSGGLTVAALWRYPVKSLQGERLDRADLGPEGIVGDRGWALFDETTGFGLTARRVPELLFAAARLAADGGADVVLPDGTVTRDDAVLSDWAGRRIALRRAGDVAAARRYESPDDVADDGQDREWRSFTGAHGAFHDGADFRVTLVSEGTLGDWDPRRFRANLVLAGAGEDALVGSRVAVGTAELEVVGRVSRCVMVTRPQAGGIGRDTGVLRAVHRERDGELAVGARVPWPGSVAVGDEVRPV
ncbi:MOSC N-terminal beta barrel domain-containing protein [Modestobacter sp. NPDC049651]|uniref:MOSC domain-containing protein n=1 Tax=unclassified Modestobacter TaxID=2643866 RepID=UPI0033F47F68